MESIISSADKKIDQLGTKLAELEISGEEVSEDTLMELKTELEETIETRAYVYRGYVELIEERIGKLTESDLESIMTQHNLTFSQAKDYVYNQIMSTNGDNVEAYYQAMELGRKNGITPENVLGFNICVQELIELKKITNKKIAELREQKSTELNEYARLTEKITLSDTQISKIKAAFAGAGYMINQLNDEDVVNLSAELIELGIKYDQLDKDSTDLTLEILKLRKETGLKKLIHKSKRQEMGQQVREKLGQMDETKGKKKLTIASISQTARIIWQDLTEEEKREFIQLAKREEFKTPQGIKTYLANAITTRNADELKLYYAELGVAFDRKDAERKRLLDERAPYAKAKKTIDDIEAKPHEYLPVFNLPKDKQTRYEIIASQFPFILELTDEELQVISDVKLTPETMVIKPAKEKSKIKER